MEMLHRAVIKGVGMFRDVFARQGTRLLASAAACVFFATPLVALAQADAQPGAPTTQSIIDALKPDAEAPRGRTRGLSLEPPAGPAVKPRIRPQEPVDARHVDLQVPFEFDSDQLTDEGRDLLDKLSQALASQELSGIRSVTFEGHTDGVGSAAYNRALSLRRAQSVKRYLQAVPELRGKLFRVVGKGTSELLDRNDPASSVNRRVRVVVYYAEDRAAGQQ